MKKIFCLILFVFSIFFAKDTAFALEDGIYSIKSAMNDNMAIDIYMGWTKNETNIQLYTDNSGTNQLWDVKSIGDGYYTIKSVSDNSFSLDAYGVNPKAGANIQLYKYNGGNNQKWIIKDAGDGNYYIVCKHDNLYLDVYYSLDKNGTNIQLYNETKGTNQKWRFEKKQTIDNGTYTIESALNNNLVIQPRNGISSKTTNVQLEQLNDKDYQKWEVKYLNNGYYSIKMALNTNVSLDVHGANKTAGTNTEVYDSNSNDNQQWVIKDAGGGNYYIISKCNNLALDVYYGTAKAGTNIQMYTQNGGNNQKFKFEQASMEEIDQPLDEGTYIIQSALSTSNNNMVVDVYNAKANDGSNVELYAQNGGNNQKWTIEPLSDGYYTITTGMSENMSLDVYKSLKTPGTNVQLYQKKSGDNQKWIIKDAGDGYYYIISKCNNLYLDVYHGLAKNGTNLQLWSYSGDKNQKFKFVSTEINKDTSKDYNGKKFSFTTLLDTNQAIDISGGITLNNQSTILYKNGNRKNQLWYAEYFKDGYYTIRSVLNKKVVLTIRDNSKEEGAEIVVYPYNGGTNQHWRIKEQGNNNVSFVSSSGELYITASGSANNSKLILKKENDSANQNFKKTEFKGDLVYHGFDISHWNTQAAPINWDAIANNDDIDFVIIHAGFGSETGNDGTCTKHQIETKTCYTGDQMDPDYINYVEACEDKNIPYAVYLYSYAKNIEMINSNSKIATIANKATMSIATAGEAGHMLNLLKRIEAYGYKPILGTQVFFDMEDDDQSKLGKPLLTSMADTFCQQIINGGYSCGIYANDDWFTHNLDANYLSQRYTLWYANPNLVPYKHPSFALGENALQEFKNKKYYTYFQFASDGRINGINGDVDLNLGLNIFDTN